MTQHFGVPAAMTKSQKYTFPFRNNPVRTIGETEGRVLVGYCGMETIAEMLDRSNNQQTQRNMVWSMLSSDTPTNIDRVVDRSLIPYGGSRSITTLESRL